MVEFTKKNQYQWERRREIERRNMIEEEEMGMWMESDKEAKIVILKESKRQQDSKKDGKEERLRRAKMRNMHWKQWRKPEGEEEPEPEQDEEVEAKYMDEEKRDERKRRRE